MDRFQMIEIDSPVSAAAAIPEDPEVTLARLLMEEAEAAPEAAAAPSEHIVRAEAGSGSWGDASFHNLDNGARASGEVVSAHSLLRSADLEWDPVIVPLRTAEGLPLPSDVGRAVIRSDNRQPIGCVGDRYTVIPHRKLADLADALVRADGKALHFGNAGHKQNGARPFLQLKSSPRSIGKDSNARDVEVYDMLTLMTSHDGSLRMVATYGACVIVCDNTYAHALSAAHANGIAVRHTASGLATVDEAIRIADAARDYSGRFDNAALRLMLSKFGDDQMIQLASALIPGDTTRAENDRKRLMDAWQSAPGANPGTAWGAAQAVTYYTTHEIGIRGETDRSFALATGEGRGSEIQASAWWHLTEAEGQAALQTVQIYRS